MGKAIWTCMVLAALAAPAVAENRGVPLCLGDRAATEIAPAGDRDTYVLDACAGTKLSLALKATKKSALRPALEVLGPSGAPLDLTDHVKAKGSKPTRTPKVSRLLSRTRPRQTDSGSHDLRMRTQVGGLDQAHG